MKCVLFICTANYYRSRFAEAVFNHHARRERLEWRAISRGLATYLVSEDISSSTLDALADRHISRRLTAPTALQLTEVHLEDADLAIALEEQEHHPIMQDLFPYWADKIHYWDVPDKNIVDPQVALPVVEEYVMDLLERLKAADQAEEEAAENRATGKALDAGEGSGEVSAAGDSG